MRIPEDRVIAFSNNTRHSRIFFLTAKCVSGSFKGSTKNLKKLNLNQPIVNHRYGINVYTGTLPNRHK